jgi:hypothetical protein
MQDAAHSIAARPVPSRHRLVDHDRQLAASSVAVVDRAAGHNGNAHGLEIVRAHPVVRDVQLLARTGLVTRHAEAHVAASADIERHGRRKPHGIDAGNACNARDELLIEDDPSGFVVAVW